MKKIEKCSCDEATHLRAALKAILRVSADDTGQGYFDDLVQISNLADQGLRLKPLVGDPDHGKGLKP